MKIKQISAVAVSRDDEWWETLYCLMEDGTVWSYCNGTWYQIQLPEDKDK